MKKRLDLLQDVTREDFPLPTLGPKLVAFREEVSRGRGFQLFRCAQNRAAASSRRCAYSLELALSTCLLPGVSAGAPLRRGVPVQRYSRQETMAAYWGIGTYWGKAQSNNKKGHLTGHVRWACPPLPDCLVVGPPD